MAMCGHGRVSLSAPCAVTVSRSDSMSDVSGFLGGPTELPMRSPRRCIKPGIRSSSRELLGCFVRPTPFTLTYLGDHQRL